MGLRTLSIDIGGTGTKMLVLDADGQPVTERMREKTPHPTTPKALLHTLSVMIAAHKPFDRVSVGFPGVVAHGVVRTAPNLGTELWEGQSLQTEIAELTGRPTRVINDADLQGYGVIQGTGVELVLTLGTGLDPACTWTAGWFPTWSSATTPSARATPTKNAWARPSSIASARRSGPSA